MTTFTSQINQLRTELTEAITALIQSQGKAEFEISYLVADPTWVIRYDKNGHPYECRVVKISIESDHIILTAHCQETDTTEELDSRYDIGARMVEWLESVLENITETIAMK